MAGLRVEQDGPLARIIFAREKGINIFTVELLKELGQAWKNLPPCTRVCILRGEGKAFMAGADIKTMVEFNAAASLEFAALGQSVFERIESSDIVSIAAIHGACLGGGCELALACDIRIGSAEMQIGQPEVNIGLIPGFGGSQRLPRIVGLGHALRIILSGEALTAEQALNAGLITESGDPVELAFRADRLARVILSRGPNAVKTAKRLTRASLTLDPAKGMELEREAFAQICQSAEAKEGMRAFIEKRSARY